MQNKKILPMLLGATILFGSNYVFGQANEMPPQVVSDAGVELMTSVQDAPAMKFEPRKEAEDVLRERMDAKDWYEGWDEEKKRFIAIGTATFKSANPAKQKDIQIRRRFAAKEAALLAKGKIITFIRQEMEAADQIVTPGTDLNKAMNAEVEALMDSVTRQKEVLASLLEKKNKAEAEVLRGTTFGDRLDDAMVATIKALDEEYEGDVRDKAAAKKYKQAVATYEQEKSHFDEIVKKAESLRGKVVEEQKSMIKSMAAMPVFGSSVVMQTESWDEDGTYQVSVMMVWSNVLERAARAIVTGEEYKAKPSQKGKTVQQWLRTQDLATMVGPRQYIDKNGNRWFLGVAAESANRRLHPRTRNINQQRARLFASQEALYCVSSDVKTSEVAEDILQVRDAGKTSDGYEEFSDHTASSFARNLEQKSKMTIRGGSVLYSKTVRHPISGDDIYVVVYGFNPNSVGPALKMWDRLYATKIQAEHYQTVEKGRQAANIDAVERAKNRPEDFKKGYKEQTNAIRKEINRRKPAKTGGVRVVNQSGSRRSNTPAKSTAGSFGGDDDVDDDF